MLAYYIAMRFGHQIIVVGLCALLCMPQAAANASAPETMDMNAVDRELLLEFIKFSRFNIHFRLESNRHQPWRFWTYALGREAGTAATFGGTLTDIVQQADGLNNPRRISKSAVVNGMASSITGNAISGCASSLELVQNTWIMWRAKKAGYSPKDSTATAKRMMTATNALFEKRQQLISLEASPAARKVHEMESELLKRIRQQLLYEFLSWSVHSRDQAWRENTFYTIDAADNFTRMAATILARRALDNRSYAKPAVVCSLIANSALTLNPIFRNIVGRTVGRHQKHKLAKEFSFERPIPAENSIQELQQMQANYPEGKEDKQLAELIELSERSGRLDAALDRETKDIERYRQIAQQQSVAGPLIGSTGLTSSILSSIAIYNYSDKPVVANRLGFSGRITQSTGQVAALILTPYTVVRGMIFNSRRKSRGELPEQILEQRLARLDRLEARVKGITP